MNRELLVVVESCFHQEIVTDRLKAVEMIGYGGGGESNQ